MSRRILIPADPSGIAAARTIVGTAALQAAAPVDTLRAAGRFLRVVTDAAGEPAEPTVYLASYRGTDGEWRGPIVGAAFADVIAAVERILDQGPSRGGRVPRDADHPDWYPSPDTNERVYQGDALALDEELSVLTTTLAPPASDLA